MVGKCEVVLRQRLSLWPIRVTSFAWIVLSVWLVVIAVAHAALEPLPFVAILLGIGLVMRYWAYVDVWRS
jgi:hypothetical protein